MFSEHLAENGTIRELTVHDTPEQNGVAERGNRTNLEHARAMLIASSLPRSLWTEAINHFIWIRNRTPTRALKDQTPFEAATKRKPDLRNLPEFGASAYVKRVGAGKLNSQVEVGRFVGFDLESKGYRVYWPEKRSVSVEREVVFGPHEPGVIVDCSSRGRPRVMRRLPCQLMSCSRTHRQTPLTNTRMCPPKAMLLLRNPRNNPPNAPDVRVPLPDIGAVFMRGPRQP